MVSGGSNFGTVREQVQRSNRAWESKPNHGSRTTIDIGSPGPSCNSAATSQFGFDGRVRFRGSFVPELTAVGVTRAKALGGATTLDNVSIRSAILNGLPRRGRSAYSYGSTPVP